MDSIRVRLAGVSLEERNIDCVQLLAAKPRFRGERRRHASDAVA